MATVTTHRRGTGFRNGGTAITAQLHLPPEFQADRSWPAVVLSTPCSGRREQVGAIYARKLAARGFIAITFAPAHQRATGRASRDLDDPATPAGDLRCALDHLVTLPFVDDARIAVLGVCAGGGHAVDAALTEHRFKAVATVAGTDLVPGVLVQPLMVIVGGGEGTTHQYAAGRALYGLACGPDKALVVIPGAGHRDLHHRDEHIDPAIERLAPFLHFHLDP